MIVIKPKLNWSFPNCHYCSIAGGIWFNTTITINNIRIKYNC